MTNLKKTLDSILSKERKIDPRGLVIGQIAARLKKASDPEGTLSAWIADKSKPDWLQWLFQEIDRRGKGGANA